LTHDLGEEIAKPGALSNIPPYLNWCGPRLKKTLQQGAEIVIWPLKKRFVHESKSGTETAAIPS
jgi:hypothetical protein